MIRIALVAIGALIALYLLWNFLQLFFGIFGQRRAGKSKKPDDPAWLWLHQWLSRCGASLFCQGVSLRHRVVAVCGKKGT